MNVKIPPSAALRTFSSAARHLSFTKAAEELFITQSAVSHQIRHIEEIWGFKLFNRNKRTLALTEEGKKVLPIIETFLTTIADTVMSIQNERREDLSVRVSLLQSFAYRWLLPRLASFHQNEEAINVWLSTTDALVDLNDSEVDVAIRLGIGRYASLKSIPLLKEYVFPVCSPTLLERYPQPQKVVDILKMPLLYRTALNRGMGWGEWFRNAGVKVEQLPSGPYFSDTNIAVQSAVDGVGVALARSAHVVDDIKGGRLVRLGEVVFPSPVNHYIVLTEDNYQQPHIRFFIDWLLDEAAQSQKEFDRQVGE